MILKPQTYRNRLIDEQVVKYLKIFGALCIEGPKWCGKTWTSLAHANSIFDVGNPNKNFQNRRLAELGPTQVLIGETPRLIDEWQDVPSLWDAVRAEVDSRDKKGQFILTGSSTPSEKGVMHSGIGRIHTIQMRTLSLFESGDSNGQVSLLDLFDNKVGIELIESPSLETIIEFVIRGGWPSDLEQNREFYGETAKSYLSSLVNKDIRKLDGVKRDKNKFIALLRSLARNESTLAGRKVLINDINKYEKETIQETTLVEYLDTLERLFIIEDINAFDPNYRSSKRVARTPKRHFTDPSLAVAALGLTKTMLINDLEFFGFLFESLVIRDLKIYADTIGAQVLHYKHHDTNHELDAVVERDDGRWIAVEIKLGANQIDEAAQSLLKINEYFNKSDKFRKPSALVVICGLTNAYYQREDGVIVVPLTALKP